jgi:hypothetical protein
VNANTLCQALHSGTTTGGIGCGGRTWEVSTGCGPSLELTADGSFCNCDSGYTVRPCIGNDNWGGVNGPTCNGLPSPGNNTQTMTVVCK